MATLDDLVNKLDELINLVKPMVEPTLPALSDTEKVFQKAAWEEFVKANGQEKIDQWLSEIKLQS